MADARVFSDLANATDGAATSDLRIAEDTHTATADLPVPADAPADQGANRDTSESDRFNPQPDGIPPEDAVAGDSPRDQAPPPDQAPDERSSDLADDTRRPDRGRPDSALDSTADVPSDGTGPDVVISPDAAAAAALCTSTLGIVATAQCCSNESDFPNSCVTGGCGCAPAYSHTIVRCDCSMGACFLPGLGCAGASGICTLGADQTCNDSPVISSIHGRCVEGGRCVCKLGSGLNTSTGKCF